MTGLKGFNRINYYIEKSNKFEIRTISKIIKKMISSNC